ncbi:MAG: class I adenylate-forming enzyme family protein [Jatrophihabitantaceae bacterium]
MNPVSRGALAADPAIGAGNVLQTLLERGADPDGPGLSFDTAVEHHRAEHRLSLGELDQRVTARAAGLHARGIGPRDPVAIWSGTAADHILSFLAATRLGAIPALVNGNLPAETVAAYIRGLRASATFADAGRVAQLAGENLGTSSLGDVAELGGADPADAPAPYRHHPQDPVVLTHTSGTTGMPKAVLHTHASLFAATRHLLSMPQAQGTRRILNALPAAHTATVLMVNQALANRADLLALSSQQGQAVLDAIQRWRAEGVFGFSVTWAQLARLDLSRYDLDCVRLWFNTGDCTHEPHVRHLVAVGSHEVMTRQGVLRRAGSSFIDGLGSSEMGHSMFHVTHRSDTDTYDRCIGRPYRFAEAAVLAQSGEQVPDGEVGHLGIRSPSLSPGYWNDSATTYRSRLNGFYLTGDLVRRHADGRYFHLDRAADSIVGPDGAAYYTALSEERIQAACPEVLDCTVVINRIGDEVVTDVLLDLDPAADQDVTALGEQVRAALGPVTAATVRRITVATTDEVPQGATGKVRKAVLRERSRTR